MVVLLFLGYVTIYGIELLSWEQKDKTKVVVFTALMGASFLFSLLLTMGISIPSIAEPIESMVITIKGFLSGG